MRELDRDLPDIQLDGPVDPGASVGVVGAGRLGNAMVSALRETGREVHGPVGRGVAPAGEIVLLCVPDAEIAAAAATVAGAGKLVGHTSGATPLAALAPAVAAGAELFGLHPLQTFARPGARLAGSGCAVATDGHARFDRVEHLGVDRAKSTVREGRPRAPISTPSVI